MANLDTDGLTPDQKIRIAAALIAGDMADKAYPSRLISNAKEIEKYIRTGQ